MVGPCFDNIERAQLCDLFEQLGPDAPTLIVGWTTRDLVAHLVLREHDPLAGPGLVLPGAWSRLAERRRREAATADFDRLVSTFRSGPSGIFRASWMRRVPNLNEFFVHHEDVRRANGQGPRALTAGMDDALWANVRLGAWFLARRLHGVGLELLWDGTVETVRARRGTPTACITGLPGELLLHLFGRRQAARVEINGTAAAIAAVQHTHFGM